MDSPVLDDSLLVDQAISLKYFAAKDGWESSQVDSMRILRSGRQPSSYELTYEADEKYRGIGKSLLFDLEKGPANFGDNSWMAFTEEPFVLNCEFERDMSIRQVILSSMVHTDPHIFPPSAIKVYGGMKQSELKILGTFYPKALKERQDRHFKYYEIKLDTQAVKFLKIEVTPLRSIPIWHAGKGEKGWFFIDEIVLAEN